MKHESVIKDVSALSFEASHVTADRRPAITDSRPRLTPVSVRDFNAQKVLLLFSNDPGFQVSVRQALPQQIELMPVRHAEQAVRLAHQDYIDAALLDLDLDDCEGWRTAERLLADDSTVRLLLAVETMGRAELVAGVSAGVLLEKPANAAQGRGEVRLSSSSDEARTFPAQRQSSQLPAVRAAVVLDFENHFESPFLDT